MIIKTLQWIHRRELHNIFLLKMQQETHFNAGFKDGCMINYTLKMYIYFTYNRATF